MELYPFFFREEDIIETVPIENIFYNSNLKIFKDENEINIQYIKEYKMSNAYELLNKGGNPYTVMNLFLGCESEIYFDSDKYNKVYEYFQNEILKK